MNEKLFSVEKLSFSFIHADRFFEDVSFSCTKPGLIFVQGKNGVGKSTLFRLLQGNVLQGESASGHVCIGGSQYNLAHTNDRASLSTYSMCLAQDSNRMVAPNFTGLENIAYACFERYPAFSRARVVQEPLAMAEQFSVPLGRYAGELSGGQRQMLALLMVTQRPLTVLFLDEPTAALDEKNARLVMDFVRHVVNNKNIFCVCISHDEALIQAYADTVLQITKDDAGKRILSVVKN